MPVCILKFDPFSGVAFLPYACFLSSFFLLRASDRTFGSWEMKPLDLLISTSSGCSSQS